MVEALREALVEEDAPRRTESSYWASDIGLAFQAASAVPSR